MGKTLRCSHDRANGKSALHLVSAWVTEPRLVLGQLKTKDKSREITTIPALIKILALQAAVVTIDAMGCQKNFTAEIIASEADYVLQVRDNQQGLRQDIALVLQELAKGFFDVFETVAGEHGRIETRGHVTTGNMDWLPGKNGWPWLKTIFMAVREREVQGRISAEISYFITGLHWCLDISFREYHCCVQKDHGPENLAILRHLVISMLKREHALKGDIRTKRLLAAWDKVYSLKVLGA